MKYTVYDPRNGKILRYGEAPDNSKQGNTVLKGVALEDDKYYIFGEVGVLRPSIETDGVYQIAADGVAEVSFSLPDNTTIIHEGVSYPNCDSFSFTTDKPGKYLFEFEPPFPYLPNAGVIINAI